MNGTCLLFLLAEWFNDKQWLLVATCHVFPLGHDRVAVRLTARKLNSVAYERKTTQNTPQNQGRMKSSCKEERYMWREAAAPGGRSKDQKREGWQRDVCYSVAQILLIQVWKMSEEWVTLFSLFFPFPKVIRNLWLPVTEKLIQIGLSEMKLLIGD